jgi:hypothetical protein
MATYYYSACRPEEEMREEHSTLFQDRPGEANKDSAAKKAFRAICPPIVVGALKRLRG